MQRWQVGDVTLVRIADVEVDLPADGEVPAWAIPDFAPSPDQVRLAFSAVAIASGERRIVVDPWLVNDQPRTSPHAHERVEGLLGRLADAGFPAGRVDLVVNTHIDGFGWNTRPTIDADPSATRTWAPTFPRARYLFPRADVDRWRDGGGLPEAAGLADLVTAGVLDPVDPSDLPVELAPGVSVESAPGHADGHLAVRIASAGALALVPGHLILSPLQVGDPSRSADNDPALAEVTRRRLLGELADHAGLLVATLLGGPGGGVVSHQGDGFRLDATS
jgi:glyoxylase-like metal-dependent hydrolase (beta-lactamase superfamily II)